jgi:hypothetical protein
MTKKKEKLEPVDTIKNEVTEVLDIESPDKSESPESLDKSESPDNKPELSDRPTKSESKKENKPVIFDIEVAKKLVNIHSSAQSRNLEFNLTFECVKKLLEYTTCYYTNIQFTEDGPNARSFDRVDNDKGYVIGNVVACTIDINGKKNNLSIDEIVCLYKKLSYLKK